MRSGEEIVRATRAFAARWRDHDSSERSDAQTFLNELLACYGTDRHAAGVRFEDTGIFRGIVDMHWPGVCIVEMKSPCEAAHLERHLAQAYRYWQSSASVTAHRPAPPYLVLCAFSRFEVWEPGRFPEEPRASFALDELPDRYEALLFLSDPAATPIFSPRRALTREAAVLVGRLYTELRERRAEEEEKLRNFVLQVVWCLFAENVGLIDNRPVEQIVSRLRADATRSAAAELGWLFQLLGQRGYQGGEGVYARLPWVNGGLFRNPAGVDLWPGELAVLAEAAEFGWAGVDPAIFGSIMESCLDEDARRDLGAHYTHEVDVMKIVRPTIVEPWRRRIEAATTPAEAERALADLCRFTVLDPACGCGNFLYVAYRELRRLERAACQRIDELARETGIRPSDAERPRYPIRNIHGIDRNAFAVKIARVTLWMGHKLAADEFGSVEPPLPLTDLSTIRNADALTVPWPDADAIVGNPPFLGAKHVRRTHGAEYARLLDDTFGVGTKDMCVYWFRKAHDHLRPGGRAGLIATNSIRHSDGRAASLEYVLARGGVIVDAVSSQDWRGGSKTGGPAVHVSIVNWVKEPAEPVDAVLDGVRVGTVLADLEPPWRSTLAAVRLPRNTGYAFAGVVPQGDGFLLAPEEAAEILADRSVDYARVVRPYLTGDDIVNRPDQSPSRYVVDFGRMSLEEALRYPRALDVVRARVRPQRERSANRERRRPWWLLGRQAHEMRVAIAVLSRFVAGNALGKRLLFDWYPPEVCPSNLVCVFAFDSDYAMGVLTSGAHRAWALGRGSELEDRPRYTVRSVFHTFPWPQPAAAEREQVTGASRRLLALRRAVCRDEGIGLTTLYNRVDDGAYAEVKAAHLALDQAVAAAYGWPKAVAHDDDETLRRLLALNLEIAAGDRPYDPFGAPDTTAHLPFEA